ncbi:MAG: insulinase family protein, partial [Bacteroidales bacterium]|nr:insulinase family protein [Bacteroidales bacterium]
MKLMWKELDKFVAEPLTPRVLAAAKKQMVGQLAISGDNAEAKSLTVGKSLLLTGNVTSLEKIRSEIEAVTAEEIQEVAKEILNRSRMSRLVFY